MMMIFFIFPFMMFISSKYFMFFNSFMFWGFYSFMFISLSCFLIIFILNMLFVCFNKLEKVIYSTLFFMVLLFMNFCFSTENLLIFLMTFEISVVPMIVLIMNFGKGFDKISSSIFMMIMNMIGSVPFMILMFFFDKFFYSFSMLLLFNMNWMSSLDSMFLFFFLNLIFFFKLPLFFFHFWLTKAHVSASGASSMILASLMLKLGSMGLLKFSFMFFPLYNKISLILSPVMIFSLISVSLLMIRCFDLKYMVAFSSIIHMSIIPFIIFTYSMYGLISSMFMMIGHGLISFFLFFFVTVSYEQTFNRSMEFNKSYDSFSKIFSWFLILYFLLNFGMPPFMSFISELYCFFCFFKLSSLMVLFFFLSLMLMNMVLMFSCTKFLLGKKYLMMYFDLNISFIFLSFFGLIMLVLMPFMC